MKLPKLAKCGLIISLMLGLSGLAIGLSTSSAHADNPNICNVPGVSDQVKAASGCPDVAAPPAIEDVVVSILNGIIAITGLVAVVAIVIAGINYITSAGDAAKVEKAKRTILYACIGLAVCALSFALVNFVIVNIIHGQSTDSDGSDSTPEALLELSFPEGLA